MTRTVSPATANVIGDDLSVPPVTSNLPLQSTLMFGATWQTRKGVFFGAGLDWSAKAEDREDTGIDSDDNFGTKFGWQFRIGYHPGVAGHPVPIPPPPPPPPPPPAPSTRSPIDAQCDPCTVEVGATSNVTATARIRSAAPSSISGARRPARSRIRRSRTPLDRAEHARHGTGHGHRHLPERQA